MLCLTRLSLARASDSRAFVFAVYLRKGWFENCIILHRSTVLVFHTIVNLSVARDLATAEHQEERDEDDITMLHTRMDPHMQKQSSYTAALSREESAISVTKVFEGGGWREEGMTRTLYLPPVEGECGGPSAGHMLSVRASTPAGAQIEEVVH